jgi:hypothetical protein
MLQVRWQATSRQDVFSSDSCTCSRPVAAADIRPVMRPPGSILAAAPAPQVSCGCELRSTPRQTFMNDDTGRLMQALADRYRSEGC